jgi:hypothetical protein
MQQQRKNQCEFHPASSIEGVIDVLVRQPRFGSPALGPEGIRHTDYSGNANNTLRCRSVLNSLAQEPPGLSVILPLHRLPLKLVIEPVTGSGMGDSMVTFGPPPWADACREFMIVPITASTLNTTALPITVADGYFRQ